MLATCGGGADLQARRKMKASEDAINDRLVLERCAARHIRNYFRDLPAPSDVDLCDRRYLRLCVDSNICDAVDAAYRAMAAGGILQSACGDGTIGEDVRFVIKLLKGIRAKCIPQEFSAGIFLMHLEIMEGLKF